MPSLWLGHVTNTFNKESLDKDSASNWQNAAGATTSRSVRVSTKERRSKMLERLLVTDDSKATAILRLVLGIVFFAHGAQKLLGWYGGPGFSGSMSLFTGYLHIPVAFAFLAIAGELFWGLGLILGLLPRIAAFGIAMDMVAAIAMVHRA